MGIKDRLKSKQKVCGLTRKFDFELDGDGVMVYMILAVPSFKKKGGRGRHNSAPKRACGGVFGGGALCYICD